MVFFVMTAVLGLVRPAASGAEPGVGGVTSGPIEYLTTVPFDAGTAQVTRLVDDTLFLASWRHISIYDVSDPLTPQLLGHAPTGFQFPAERMDTNGKILIIGEEMPVPRLHVWDVSDPTAPFERAVLDGAGDHTFACVLDCRWAYGSFGTIVDLRDPDQPKVVGDWSDGVMTYGHDVTEVAPGIVLTSSDPVMRLLDARRDPASPRELAAADTQVTGGHAYVGTNVWPRRMRDRFLLTSEETAFEPQCSDSSSAFATWDTKGWKRFRTFRLLDTYRLGNGTITDGNAPANVVGCSTHMFDEHPDFADGGRVALAHYEHGLRLLHVARNGRIEEQGWFLPWGGEVSSAQWITDEILYSIDLARGIDILRVAK